MKLSHITLSAFKSLLIVAFLPLFLIACGGSDTSPPSQGEKIINPLKNIELTADSTSQITLSWNAVDGASYYEIYKNTTNTTSGLTFLSSQTSTIFRNTGLKADTIYYYWGKVCKKEGSVGSAGSSINTAGHSCTAFSKGASKTTWVVTPNVPTDTSLTADSTSQMTVSWTGNGANFYKIYRNTSDSNTSLTAAIATTTNASYEDTGLTANTTYYYWIKACNTNISGERCSDFSIVSSKTTIPNVPTGLSLTADSASQMTVSWIGNGATSYEIYRNTTNSNAGLTAIATPSTDAAYVNNTGLSANRTYYYWVKACNTNTSGKRCSGFSTVASKTTIPKAPPFFSASASSTSQILVQWRGDAAYYEIYRNTTDSTTGLPVLTTTTNSIKTPGYGSYRDKGLKVNTLYYYWIKACNTNTSGKRCSDFKAVNDIHKSQATQALTPNIPTGLRLTIDSASQITLSWDMATTGVTYYELYINWLDSENTTQSLYNNGLYEALLGSTGSYYIHTGFISSTTYHYRLVACKDNVRKRPVCSDFTEFVSTTSWVVAPSVPAGVSLSAGADSSSQITVSWNNDVAEAEYYELYRNTSNSTANLTAIDSPLASGGTTYTYTDGGLSPNTTYYYWLKACRTGNNCSVFSEVASTKTQGESIYSWSRATSSRLVERSGHSSVVFDHRLWAIAGYSPRPEDTRQRVKKDVLSSTNGITWTTATDSAAFLRRTDHQSVVFNDGNSTKMWVISGSFKNDVWNSTDGVTWTTATDSAAFSDRTHHTAVVFKDKMWVIGGYTGSSRYANDVWNSTDGVTWTPVTNSAQFPARSNHTTVVFKDQIWVIGGADRSKILDRVDEPYSPKNDVWRSTNGITWTTATDSAQFPARGDHTSVVFDNKIWVIGGDIRDDSDSDSYYGIRANDVWSSTDGITWTKMDNPGFAVRDSHSSVVFNNRVWVIGGFFEDDVWYMVKE